MTLGRAATAVLLLGAGVAWLAVGAWPLLAQLAEGTVQIQDGGGNIPQTLESGQLIVVLIKDADLRGSNTGVATWTNIPEQVDAYEVWDLVSGSPHSFHEDGHSRIALMLRYTIRNPQADTVVIGTLSLEDMVEDVRAIKRGTLPPDTLPEANRRLEPLGFAASRTA